MNHLMFEYNQRKKIISVCLLLLVLTVALTACSKSSGEKTTADPVAVLTQTASINGTTSDKAAQIVVTQVTATIDKEKSNNIIIVGMYELTNISTVSLSIESINFGILDKQTDAQYWGSTSVSGSGEIAPNQTVRGVFAIQVPRTIDLKQSDLIFGKIPNINFQKPLVPNK